MDARVNRRNFLKSTSAIAASAVIPVLPGVDWFGPKKTFVDNVVLPLSDLPWSHSEIQNAEHRLYANGNYIRRMIYIPGGHPGNPTKRPCTLSCFYKRAEADQTNYISVVAGEDWCFHLTPKGLPESADWKISSACVWWTSNGHRVSFDVSAVIEGHDRVLVSANSWLTSSLVHAVKSGSRPILHIGLNVENRPVAFASPLRVFRQKEREGLEEVKFEHI